MSLTIEMVGQALLDTTAGYDEALEQRLRSYEQQVGYLSSLIQLLTIPDVPFRTRQASAIRLRRFIMKKWQIGNFKDRNLNLIHDSDRQTVRANLVKVIVQESDPIVRQLLSTSVFYVAKQDYPTSWSTEALVPIAEVLTSNQQNGLNTPYALSGALQCLFQIVRVRRASIASNKQERAIQNDIFANLGSSLLSILGLLLEQENSVVARGDAEHITWLFETTHVILKIISIAFQQVTLPFFKIAQNVNTVTQLLLQSARNGHLSYCAHLYSTMGDRAYQHSIFKRRKWAFRVLARLYRCVLRITEKSKAAALEQTRWNMAWKRGFQEYVFDATFNSFFQLTIPGYELRSFKEGLTVTPQPTSPHIDAAQQPIDYRVAFSPDVGGPMLRIIFTLLEQKKDSAKFINTYIYSKLDLILTALSSTLRLSASDVDGLLENPVHFIEYTLNSGLVESVNDVYYTCDSILHLLFSKKPALAPQFLEYLINQPLNCYKTLMAQPNLAPQQHVAAILSKDAAMRVFGGLSRVFDHDNFVNHSISFLQSLLHEHVSSPAATWPAPHLLECRTLWCFFRFKPTLCNLSHNTSHPLHNEAVLISLSCASQCLSLLIPTPELKRLFDVVPGLAAARIQASATLLALLKIKQVKDAIFPFAAQLFLSILEILEQYDIENLNILFQQLITVYRDSLFPVAQQVLERLVPKFMVLLEELTNADGVDCDDDNDDDDYQEKYWTAVAQLASMHTIVGAVGDSADALNMAEQHLLPVCAYIIEHELEDYMGEMCTILQCFTYYEQVISDNVWALFPPLVAYLLGGNDESYSSALSTLANFLSKDANISSRMVMWTEPGTKTPVETPAIDIFYKLIFSHFNRPVYDADAWMLQESSMHLLRTHLGWLPAESQELSPDLIASVLQRFVPCLLTQLGYALYRTHPSIIANLERDAQGRPIRDPSTITEKQRTKYAVLVLDCIQTLAYKYPSYLIDQLCNTPAPAEVQPQGHQINCLQFVLDCASTCLPTSDRAQSLYTNIIGLSTLLQWFIRPQCFTLDHSHMRANIISVLLNAIISFRRVEDEENEEDACGVDHDSPNVEEDDEPLDHNGGDDNDDEHNALLLAEKQQATLEEYAKRASELTNESFNIYYNDNNFITPLDNINYYKFSLTAITTWADACQGFTQHNPIEIELVRSFKDETHQNYPLMIDIINYAQESSDIWEQEQQEDDLEYKAEVERLQRTREEQLAQMSTAQSPK